MKYLILFLLVFSSITCLGQTNYYTFNNDSLMTEEVVKSAYDSIVKTLPPGLTFVPTVYHQIEKGDSVINYLTFVVRKSNSSTNKKFSFEYEQDSVFLFLNKKMLEFNFKDINGNEFDSKKLNGKPALINLWAIYCKPCIEEIPKLNKLKEKYGDRMNFIALTEMTCTPNDLIEFLNKNPFNFQIIQNTDKLKKSLKIKSYPKNIFIDKDGYIKYIQGNYPYEIDPKTNEKVFSEDNYFVQIIDELIKKQ